MFGNVEHVLQRITSLHRLLQPRCFMHYLYLFVLFTLFMFICFIYLSFLITGTFGEHVFLVGDCGAVSQYPIYYSHVFYSYLYLFLLFIYVFYFVF